MPVRVERIILGTAMGDGAVAVRMVVFVEEQNIPVEIEMDEYDALAQHFAAVEGGRVVGTCRCVRKGDSMKIGRVAVLKEWRGKQVGRLLMEAALAYAREEMCGQCTLTAQTQVIGFYEKLGFVAHGEVFEEAGIPHRAMERLEG